MDTNKQKIQDIQQVVNQYIGGFISGDNGMSQINDILKRKYIDVLEASLIDPKTNKVLFRLNYDHESSQ